MSKLAAAIDAFIDRHGTKITVVAIVFSWALGAMLIIDGDLRWGLFEFAVGTVNIWMLHRSFASRAHLARTRRLFQRLDELVVSGLPYDEAFLAAHHEVFGVHDNRL